ncbi:hypothetical protein ONS96_003237 [Cadophora gregata f. sp. sojae]|nr:hypothetical protein ONS96_003237 [Cadophora gregata f. sp. sojae]
MSFGTSVGDIILLIQLAHKNYRNCKEAGGEYIEIAREVRSLHSVLRTVRDEALREDSLIFKAGPEQTRELTEIADGCKGVLESIDAMLTKYKGLAPESVEVGKVAKFWDRMRFGTEIEDLGKLRWKIITYTSTLAVLVDSINLKATERVGDVAGRIEGRVETGFADISDRLEKFEDMRKAVLFIATRARASQRYLAMESVLSLSTYADDDKEVWRQFHSQLVSLGFKSDSLDRHMEVLKAYMMKLDQTGVLDEAVKQSDVTTQSWCGNASFRTTNLSLLGTEMGELASEAQDESDFHERPMSLYAASQSTIDLQSPIVDDRHIDGVALSSPSPTETATRARRRVPRIKVEQSGTVKDSEVSQALKTPSPVTLPVEKHINQLSSINDIEHEPEPEPAVEVDSGIDVSKSRKPHSYAESYYSVSEAATSPSTLLRAASQSTKPSSLSKESKPRNTNRATSWGRWSEPTARRAAKKYQQPLSEMSDVSDSDDTVGPSRSRKRSKETEISPIGSTEKVDDWLKPPSEQRRTRASSSPTRHKPLAKSMEELPSGAGGGNALNRPSSAANARKKVNFDSPKPFVSRPAEDLHEEFFGDTNKQFFGDSGKKSRDKADSGHKRSSPKSSPRNSQPRIFSAGTSTAGSKPDTGQNFHYQGRQRSRSPQAFLNGEEVAPEVATAALIAGAVEAFRVRNEEGDWAGDKARRIFTAAMGAAGVDAVRTDGDQNEEVKKKERKESAKFENERERARKAFVAEETRRFADEFDSDAAEYNDALGGSGGSEKSQGAPTNRKPLERNNSLRSERDQEAKASRTKTQRELRRAERDQEYPTRRKRTRRKQKSPEIDLEAQNSRKNPRTQRKRSTRERIPEEENSSLARNSNWIGAALAGLAMGRMLSKRREMRNESSGGGFVASDSETESESDSNSGSDSKSDFHSDSESESDGDGDSDKSMGRDQRHQKRKPPPQQGKEPEPEPEQGQQPQQQQERRQEGYPPQGSQQQGHPPQGYYQQPPPQQTPPQQAPPQQAPLQGHRNGDNSSLRRRN